MATVSIDSAEETDTAQTLTPQASKVIARALEFTLAQTITPVVLMSGSGTGNIVLSAYGRGTLDVPVTPPPAGVETVGEYQRASITMPAPVLDSRGYPS